MRCLKNVHNLNAWAKITLISSKITASIQNVTKFKQLPGQAESTMNLVGAGRPTVGVEP